MSARSRHSRHDKPASRLTEAKRLPLSVGGHEEGCRISASWTRIPFCGLGAIGMRGARSGAMAGVRVALVFEPALVQNVSEQ